MSRCLPFCLALCLLAATGNADAPAERDVRDSIVKIYTIQNRPDYYNPWSMQGPRAGTGSGCVIEGKKILTNAHVVGDQTFVQVRRYGEAKRYQAKVVSVTHEADLALLTVSDPSFFEGVEPLALGELPASQQEVHVYGFPLGGDTLSTTKGVVSRIESQIYAHSGSFLLAGQIDAAINPGNSGGPVMVDRKIVGVVMQSISQADNIGYFVPVDLVQHFLSDIKNGADGFPSLGVVLENMENPDIKRKYKMSEEQNGLLIIRVLPGSPADGVLEVGDVLAEVDGYPVADNGTIEFRHKERTSVSYLVQKHLIGTDVDLKIYRDGEEMPLTITLDRSSRNDRLIPLDRYDVIPSYYIYGGLVFCQLTKDFLKAWGPNWFNNAPKELVAMLSENFPEEEGEQVLLLLKVLPADVNQGYHSFANWVVSKVNGQELKNLADLVRKVEGPSEDPFVVFESESGQQIVLDRAKAEAAEANILQVYRIAQDRSDDLKGLQAQ